MTSSGEQIGLKANRAAANHARPVAECMSDHTNTSDDYEEVLSHYQKLLAEEVLTYLGYKRNNPLVWVNTYLILDIEEIRHWSEEPVPDFDNPHHVYIYKHTAIQKEDKSAVEEVEELIDRVIGSPGETSDESEIEKKSLTKLLNNKWDKILREGSGLVSFYLDSREPPTFRIQEDSKLRKNFEKVSTNLQWYTRIFKDGWKEGRYVHLSRPNVDHLPVNRAGVYLMIRNRDDLTTYDLEILQLAFRSFLLEITTARLWGEAFSNLIELKKKRAKDERRRNEIIKKKEELEKRKEELQVKNEKLSRHAEIFNKIQNPLKELGEDLKEAQSSMRRIDAALPLSIDNFLFRGDTLPAYFSGTGNAIPFNKSIDVRALHDFDPDKLSRCKKIAAATLLTALQQAGDEVEEPLWDHLCDLLHTPPEDDDELVRAASALKRVLPEVTEKDPDADGIKRSFRRSKHWFNYAFREEKADKKLFTNHVYLALCIFTGDSPDSVDIGNGVDISDEWKVSDCSSKPIGSLEALHLLNELYNFQKVSCTLNSDNELIVKITHSEQKQTIELLDDALKNLEEVYNQMGTGRDDRRTFTKVLWKLFGRSSGDYRPKQIHTDGDWLVLRNNDYPCYRYDTQLYLKQGSGTCETKVIWRKLD